MTLRQRIARPPLLGPALHWAGVLLLLPALLGAQEGVDPEKARSNFEASYKAGVAASEENDWETAEVLFDSALRALGATEHPNKVAAQALLAKARKKTGKGETPKPEVKAPETKAQEPAAGGAAAKPAPAPQGQEAYQAALKEGLDKLEAKDWQGAATAFRRALEQRPGDLAARGGLKQAEEELLKAPAAAQKAEPAGGAATPAAATELPKTVELSREDWQVGAGSTCFWAGSLIHLQEGDMKFSRKLRGDFAVSIAIEAEMDHRSMIYLDLRPDKRGNYPTLRCWGSKSGSAPYLEVNKKVLGSGKAQPANKQITLSVRRAGGRTEFFCDGVAVGECWDLPGEAEVWLWVCGKGTMNGGRVEGGK